MFNISVNFEDTKKADHIFESSWDAQYLFWYPLIHDQLSDIVKTTFKVVSWFSCLLGHPVAMSWFPCLLGHPVAISWFPYFLGHPVAIPWFPYLLGHPR